MIHLFWENTWKNTCYMGVIYTVFHIHNKLSQFKHGKWSGNIIIWQITVSYTLITHVTHLCREATLNCNTISPPLKMTPKHCGVLYIVKLDWLVHCSKDCVLHTVVKFQKVWFLKAKWKDPRFPKVRYHINHFYLTTDISSFQCLPWLIHSFKNTNSLGCSLN